MIKKIAEALVILALTALIVEASIMGGVLVYAMVTR